MDRLGIFHAGKGLPHGSLVSQVVYVVFLCFCHAPIWCFMSGMALDCIDS